MAGADVYSREELCALLYLKSLCVVSLLGGDYLLYLILWILHDMAGTDVFSGVELCALLYLESLRVVSLLSVDYLLYLILKIHHDMAGADVYSGEGLCASSILISPCGQSAECRLSAIPDTQDPP